MEFHLNSEQQNKVMENEALVKSIIKNLSIPFDLCEDIFQIGIIGLMRAVVNYDSTKKSNFATYAYICIKNEIFMDFRKNKKYNECVSFETRLTSTDESGQKLLLGDTISDKSIRDFCEVIIENNDICEYINLVLNCMQNSLKIILLYEMAGIPKCCISKATDICPSSISRFIKIGRKRIDNMFKINKVYDKKFSVKPIGEKFRMKFSLNDSDYNIQDFQNFLIEKKNLWGLKEFKMSFEDGCFIIDFLSAEESFLYMADIIDRLENVQSLCKIDIYTVLKEYKNEKENKKIAVSNDKDSLTNQVRKYILKLSKFTVEQVRKNFPETSGRYINVIIQNEKERGTIKNIARGKYSVICD